MKNICRTQFKLSLLFKLILKKLHISGLRYNFLNFKDLIHQRVPKFPRRNFGSELYCFQNFNKKFIGPKQLFTIFFFHGIFKTFYEDKKPYLTIRNRNFTVNILAPSEKFLFFKMVVLFSKQTCLVQISFFENFTSLRSNFFSFKDKIHPKVPKR